MKDKYDSSWDFEGNENAFEKKIAEWRKRQWEPWLLSNLKFPFQVERIEDEDDAYFSDTAKLAPFRLGHVFKVVGIEMEDDHYGIIPLANHNLAKQ